MILFSTIKKIGTRALAVLVMASILALHPVSYQNHTPHIATVEAGGGFSMPIALEPTQRINTAWNSLTSGFTGTAEVREFSLDQIVYMITKVAMSTLIQSLTNWVNSGFQGSPTFVQDLQRHLLDIADSAAAEFLFGAIPALEALCSPFSINIQFTLTQTISRNLSDRDSGYRAQCTLSDMGENVEAFLDGDFVNGGGWRSWIQMTQRPGEHTAIGAYLKAESELFKYIAGKESVEVNMLNFGDGFLSMRDADGNVTTPGVVIAGQINKALGAGQDVLVEADEINELINALFYQLVNRVLLSGLGNSSDPYGGSRNFRVDDAMVNFDDVYDYIDPNIPDGEPIVPPDITPATPGPTSPSPGTPTDPYSGEPLDTTIPGVVDGPVDPVTGLIDSDGDTLPSADPVT